jgi:hypothetical protein
MLWGMNAFARIANVSSTFGKIAAFFNALRCAAREPQAQGRISFDLFPGFPPPRQPEAVWSKDV